MTEYLRLDDALRVIQRFGFSLRDSGLLSSALARPSASMAGIDAYKSLDRKSGALLESVVKNHALLDGNKRLGWTLLILFLWINGFRHDFTADDGFDLVTGVADGTIDLNEAERRIAAHRVPR